MNILILAELVTKSGVGSYIYQLSENLTKKGNTVIVLSPKVDVSLPAQVVVEQLPHHDYSVRKLWKDVKCLDFVVNKYHIDLIHIQHRRMSIIVMLHNLLCKKVPSVLTVHNCPVPRGMIKTFLMSISSYIIAVSTEVSTFCVQELGLNANKMRIINNGVDEKRLLPLSDDERLRCFQRFGLAFTSPYRKKITICMHGRIDPVKRIDLLVDAINMMTIEEKEKIQCIISGDTNNEYYKDIIRRIDACELNSIFHFVGWEKSRNVLGCADLMVLPSNREAFPLSVVEAFLMRVPVIRSRTGGYSFTQNICVGLKNNDAGNLYEEIKRFINDPGSYDMMVHSAYEFAHEELTIEVMTNRTIAVYEEAINENKKG